MTVNHGDFSLSSYDYQLDPNLIAQTPIEPRHNARLMVVSNKAQDFQQAQEYKVWDLQEELRAGDLLVLNDTRVLKARLRIRLPSGRQGELLVMEPLGEGCWLCLARPGRRIRVGDSLLIDNSEGKLIELAVVGSHMATGGKIIQFPSQYCTREQIEDLLMTYGEVPLPPYIKSQNLNDSERYQTRYAMQPGAVAAPTAGLHLSDELLSVLRGKGVSQVKITLHVGLGTFRPIEIEDLTDLELHSEWVEVKEEVVSAVEGCHAKGGRVFAVGTTCVRALESAYQLGNQKLIPISSKVNLVIKPGYKFGVVDGLLTNFHLPKSSLLLLVAALIGRERLMALYQKAMQTHYRFFSYGDAMLIKPEAILTSSRPSPP